MDTPDDGQGASSQQKENLLVEQYYQHDFYPIATDYHGTVRLSLQQFIWSRSLGFDIHPSIRDRLAPNASVADIACGTALWLVGAGRELGPSSDLHGFDITLKQAPPREWLPGNTALHQWNMFEEVPAEFVGKFDLAHVRLITAVVNDDKDAEIVIKNVHKLLKPGGYIQWEEANVTSAQLVKATPDLEVPALARLVAWHNRSIEERKLEGLPLFTWPLRIVDQLRGNGFEDAVRHDLGDLMMKHKELLRYNSDQLFMFLEQLSKRGFPPGSPTGVKILKMVEGAAKDSEKGAAMLMAPICWVGRKESN